MTTPTTDLTKLSPADAQAKVDALQAQITAINKIVPETAVTKKTNMIIKLNSKGGVYVTHPAFKAYSSAKEKFYTAGINMDKNVFKELFTNKPLIMEILAFIEGGMKTEYNEAV
tara:strand:- start:118 stop:459 length:342 start_codon:yes stop_codon:yes gene_type:complete